ncbi:hypothetical protein KIN20_024682 [Parelaphostrongylus tenuis]|uniref:Uncharacterized protein n=1 Tax=Parelaphostrongylus tenuis TaxID=148309 RepID=A0AAD5MTU5_PARTN|nr:hypothetical protein KIN20_024682 [Parelaphostrongylus tenuis]
MVLYIITIGRNPLTEKVVIALYRMLTPETASPPSRYKVSVRHGSPFKRSSPPQRTYGSGVSTSNQIEMEQIHSLSLSFQLRRHFIRIPGQKHSYIPTCVPGYRSLFLRDS